MVLHEVDELGFGNPEAGAVVSSKLKDTNVPANSHLQHGVRVPTILLEQAQDESLLFALLVVVVLATLDRLEEDVGRVLDPERVASKGEGSGRRAEAGWWC